MKTQQQNSWKIPNIGKIIWQNSLKQPMGQRKIIREIRNYFECNGNENL